MSNLASYAITVYQGAKNPRPVHEYELSWPDYCAALDELLVIETENKLDLPLWSPVKLKPGGTRAAKFIEHVSAIGLDIDHGSNDLLRAVIDAPFAKYVYTSPSDQGADATERRFRVVVPTTRPMAADECRAAHFAIAAALGLDAKGQGIAQTSDPSRGWFSGKLQGSPDRQRWITPGRSFDPGTAPPAPAEVTAEVSTERATPPSQSIATAAASVARIVQALGPWSDHIGRRSDLCDAIGGMLRRLNASERYCKEVIETWLDGSNTQADPKAVKKGLDRALGAWTKQVREVSGPERFMDLLDTADHAALVVQALRDAVVGNINVPKPATAASSAVPNESVAVNAAPIDTSLVLDTDKQQRPLRTIENVHRCLDRWFPDKIRFERCRGRVVCAGIDPSYGHMPVGPWSRAHTTALTRLCERYGLLVAPKVVSDAIDEFAREHAYNAVEDYLVQCANAWDGVERVDRALTDLWGCEDNEATRITSRIMLLSLAARGLMPGCKVDTCPVFYGVQGVRKSSSFNALVPDEWFSESELPTSAAEVTKQMRGKWFWEIGEGSGLSKRDRNARKRFITERVGQNRALYDEHVEDVPRLTVFVMSTNDEEFLDDPTGNRRFPVVRLVRPADIATIRALREQLLGEACMRVVKGEREYPDPETRPTSLRWWPDREEEAVLDANRTPHVETDPWAGKLAAWAEKQTAAFEIADALQFGIGMKLADCGKREQMRAANALKSRGWRRVATNGQKLWTR